jgi:DNA-binding transcriptional MerR regulator
VSKIDVRTTETEASVLWHTTADVAKRYRTAPGTVRYWRHIGYGPKGVKNGRRVLYNDAELKRFDAWLLAQAVGPEVA